MRTKIRLAVVASLFLVGVASACPLCGQALAANGNGQPGDPATAFGYAVYLLLAMPFVLAASYGWMFLRCFSAAEESSIVSSGVATSPSR